ncbi:uncharacterized protein LOC123405590 [Hordeum vulgare subsp. vulgare]|uniref:uncharacterized protein LOC123405590 n=1 Tax=Hordeum vulgare subsp. vulgare TaxID=112509 RepID=UPI001D1A3506|nr:uncharacterized protein LOC123405590 [Hordeum vulgare subsp. vulgare]
MQQGPLEAAASCVQERAVRVAGLSGSRGYGLPSEGLHKNLQPTPQPKNKVEGGLLLNVVISQGAAIFQLFPSKDKPLLVWWDTLLVLDLCLDIVNGIRTLNL